MVGEGAMLGLQTSITVNMDLSLCGAAIQC